MFATLGFIGDALVGRDPYLFPATLAVTGLLALLWASVRGRLPGLAGRTVVVRAYVGLALVCFVFGAGVLGYRAQLFWGVRASRGEIVLERLGPLADIRIPRDQVAAITEFSAPERNLTGMRSSVQFIVRTRSGLQFSSAPLYHRDEANVARTALVAPNTRLEKFIIGRVGLPE